MMFKGPSLRLSSLTLFAALMLAGFGRLQAQPGQGASYRILILDKQSEGNAVQGKKFLEGLNLPGPAFVESANGQFRTTYGNYPTETAAKAAAKALYDREKINSIGVVAAGQVLAPASSPAPQSASDNELLTIHVRDFNDQNQAEALKKKLELDYGLVMIRKVGAFYYVLVGQYHSTDAAVALGQLRKAGYQTAKVEPVPVSTAAPGAEAAAAPAPEFDDSKLALPIMDSPDWKRLTDEEKLKVRNNVNLQEKIRLGDPLAKQMVDMQARLENLDKGLQKIQTQYESEKKTLDDRRSALTARMMEAENQITSGSYKTAIVNLTKALELDRENTLGQQQFIKNRIQWAEMKASGFDYPGQKESIRKRVDSLRQTASQLKRSDDKQSLYSAIQIWNQIKDLDPSQAQSANNEIATLNTQINNKTRDEASANDATARLTKQMFIGLASAVGVLSLLVIIVWLRTRKRHMELMRKVQEITSIRPMRELEGTGQQLLGGTESDIFAPMNPQAQSAGDPLGGVLTPPPPPDKKGKGKKGKTPAAASAASESLDDIFGSPAPANGSPESPAGNMGFDNIFGSPAPAKAAPAKPAAPAAAPAAPEPPETSAIDDIFGGLFAEDKPEAKPDAANGQGAPNNNDLHSEVTVAAESDLLTVFDEQPATGKANGQEVDPLQDSPFAAMFNAEQEEGHASLNTSHPTEDTTEIPSIKLDVPAATAAPAPAGAGFDAFALHDISGAGSTRPAAEPMDLPAFTLNDFVEATAITGNGASAGVDLDFESDATGQPPQGWEGQYSFARLTVESDTPPRGAQQYLCFDKREGTGKAHFRYNFGEMRGQVGIEFDLRCNDKNKFLLGFYIEKDGDFQNSIHTKILRSEAQTSPTIHMQGQSAPYLLGSWAHIKYIVDLEAGKLNGYIDSTHVVRDLPLTPNPGMLNTLSIRDNINTTGVLLLDNIRVYPIE